MSGYAAPKIEKVRIGIIGLGNRGPSHLETMRHIEGVEIRALCDLRPERTLAAKKRLEGTIHKPTLYSGNKDEWMKLCEQEDLDLVIVTTPYYMHADMAVYAMEHGKHVASEVPAAATIEECWKLVETAERTRKHCMMLENYAYNFFQLLTLNMARQGFFGEIVHGDCAYNTSKMGNNFSKSMYWDMWWLKLYGSKRGNIYPTHGLGPVCQIMNINRGDRFDYLVSMESNDFMMRAKAQELAAQDDFFKPFAEKTYRGNMNTTIIRTVKGRTIMVQHDATSPRGPHTMIHGITGTKGMALEYPLPPRISKDLNGWVSQKEYNAAGEGIHADDPYPDGRSHQEDRRPRRRRPAGMLAADRLPAQRPAVGSGRVRRRRVEFHRAVERVVGAEPLQFHRRPRFHRRRLGEEPAEHGHHAHERRNHKSADGVRHNHSHPEKYPAHAVCRRPWVFRDDGRHTACAGYGVVRHAKDPLLSWQSPSVC